VGYGLVKSANVVGNGRLVIRYEHSNPYKPFRKVKVIGNMEILLSRIIIEGPVDNGESSHDPSHVEYGWSSCSVMLQLLPTVIDIGDLAVGFLASPPQPYH
jgi:hypothetical protein